MQNRLSIKCSKTNDQITSLPHTVSNFVSAPEELSNYKTFSCCFFLAEVMQEETNTIYTHLRVFKRFNKYQLTTTSEIVEK